MSAVEKEFTDAERTAIKSLALEAVTYAVKKKRILFIKERDFPPKLLEKRATFVTIHVRGELRGCIGVTQPIRPLVEDVANNAYSVVYHDTRFPVLKAKELDELTVSVSVLTVPEPLEFKSEEDLLRQIVPGRDGLILEDGYYRGTFLPVMWERLPTSKEFLDTLKQKAGLPPDYWSDTVMVSRYRAETVE